MSLKPIQNYFISDGVLKPVNQFVVSENEGGIYEVIRVVNGIPLFFEEHINRFYFSANLAGKKIPLNKTELKNQLNQLIFANDCLFGNVLISSKIKLKMFFILHNYPNEVLYKQGVNTGILNAERNNPNAKVFQTSVRQLANEIIQKNNLYEVLLEDNSGRITEGSRSNVFFIKAKTIFTPPAQNVLKGITREKTILLIKTEKIDFSETEIYSKNLAFYEAAFLTGTSPKLLPIKTINGFQFNPENSILQLLIKKYNLLIGEYVKERTNSANGY